MHERVIEILNNTAEQLVLPSFRALKPEDIIAKGTPGDPDDIVTVTDQTAERYLVQALTGLIPGALFIGEEAVCEDPSLVGALAGSEPVWLIDPIDGTKNFAKGNPNFGIMVALVERNAVAAAWIVTPAIGDVVWAERGQGTWINGQRVQRRVSGSPRGTVHDRLMPPDVRQQMRDRLHDKYEPRPSTGSAATEYAGILRGDKDFAIFYRLHPWDQAPGALAMTEAGGSALHLNGQPYTPLSPDQVTIFAATAELALDLRNWLL